MPKDDALSGLSPELASIGRNAHQSKKPLPWAFISHSFWREKKCASCRGCCCEVDFLLRMRNNSGPLTRLTARSRERWTWRKSVHKERRRGSHNSVGLVRRELANSKQAKVQRRDSDAECRSLVEASFLGHILCADSHLASELAVFRQPIASTFHGKRTESSPPILGGGFTPNGILLAVDRSPKAKKVAGAEVNFARGQSRRAQSIPVWILQSDRGGEAEFLLWVFIYR